MKDVKYGHRFHKSNEFHDQLNKNQLLKKTLQWSYFVHSMRVMIWTFKDFQNN
jgi:hypothetical protein